MLVSSIAAFFHSLTEETAAWAKSMGVEATTKDYKEILDDPQIDAVLICSSTDTHAPISMEAIKVGKHVFCEKPIDLDVVFANVCN